MVDVPQGEAVLLRRSP